MKRKKVVVSSLLTISAMVLGGSVSLAAQGASAGNPATRNTDGQVEFTEGMGPVSPVDPLDPITPVLPIDPIDPEKPIEPGTDGPLSLDYASSYNFGERSISTTNKTYKAIHQNVKIDGVSKDVPLYAQVTDRRGTEEGWSLYVNQENQFATTSDKELAGAQISLKNGEPATVSTSATPGFVAESIELDVDGAKHKVMEASEGQGAGTWVYRNGNADTKGESVELFVPGTATQLKETYTTTLVWTLSVLP